MADYLTDEEQLDRLKNWWQENGTSLVVAVVLALGSVAGWRWYDSAQVQEMQAASEAYESFLAATGDARTELAARLDAEYGGTSYAAFVLLHQAKEATESGDLEGAIGMFRQIADAGAHPLIADIARVRLARLLQEQDDAEGALAVLAQVTSQGFRAQVLELKGDIHVLQGERALAHEAYVAAAAEVAEGNQRPILEFKVDDTAPPEES